MILNTSLTLCMEIMFPGGGGSGRSPFESAGPGEGLEVGGFLGTERIRLGSEWVVWLRMLTREGAGATELFFSST